MNDDFHQLLSLIDADQPNAAVAHIRSTADPLDLIGQLIREVRLTLGSLVHLGKQQAYQLALEPSTAAATGLESALREAEQGNIAPARRSCEILLAELGKQADLLRTLGPRAIPMARIVNRIITSVRVAQTALG